MPIAHDAQRDERREVEQQDADLVRRHAAVMNDVERAVRQPEPLAMQFAQPVAREDQGEEPDEQNGVVEGQRPQQELAGKRVGHVDPP